jgi:ATP-dependent Lon protease
LRIGGWSNGFDEYCVFFTAQLAFDAGVERLLLPMASVHDIPTVPGELFAKFQTSSYADPTDTVFTALGVQ